MIKYRLFLAMLAATGTVVVCMFLIMQWSVDRGFLRYVNTIEQERLERLAGELRQTFSEQGNWEALRNDPIRRSRLIESTFPKDRLEPPEKNSREDAGRDLSTPPGLLRGPRQFEMRVMLLDVERKPVFGPPISDERLNLTEIRLHGKTVGYLGILPRKHLTDALQLSFVKQQKLAMALIAGAMLLVSVGLAFPLANHLVGPVRTLAAATHRLASGHFDTRVEATSADELGQLARDFNSLALALEKNEQARRRWVADISHELRTPLSILRGEIEAIQDGIRQATPEAIGSLHGEVMQLNRLVNDLYQLSLSDVGALTYRKAEQDLAAVLSQTLDSFRAEFITKNIALRTIIEQGKTIPIFADDERLHQLFENLLGNALKYTDPGGELLVRLECRNRLATVHFQDSAPGVTGDELDRLFERLYRVENSRNRASGGAGLGLAICKNIVEAHEGTIAALPSPRGGVWIKVDLPVLEKVS
jgi:two-component system sensor histidine kinase BaeS